MTNKNIFSLSSLVLLLAITFGASVAADKNQLSNEFVQMPNLGVKFKKPNGWLNPNEKAMIDNLKKIDANIENIPKILATHKGTVQLYIFHKEDPAKYPGIIPTINVLVRYNPSNDFATFMKFIKKSSDSASAVLHNWSVKKPLSEETISGKKVVSFSADFNLTTADGNTHSIRNITYSIPFAESFIQVSMSESNPPKNEKLFLKFINAFEFTNK